MTVAELQLLFSDLGRFLRASESAKVAGELEYISTKLEPFKEYKLRAFADFLEKAATQPDGAPAKSPSKGGSKKADVAAVEAACQRALHFYDRAIDPSVTLNEIEAAIQSLQELDPPKAKLDEIARTMGYSQKFKAKGDVMKAIRQKILGRKGAYDRPNA